MLRQLVHRGVVIPPMPGPYYLKLNIRGHELTLTPEQEEMALAWARKLGTEYVDDPVFVRNFLVDFGIALGIEPPLRLEDVDFAPATEIIARERAAREQMSKEERKELAAQRKAVREALKEEYGHATVDGERTELGTYLVEPSGIFMGRGKHPLRGRWKPGPKQHDITLNLSPDAPRPAGEWAETVWQPDSLWIARWKDKLSDKTKYIWLADTATVKQNKEAQKFAKAGELSANIEAVRARIDEALRSDQPRRRMVATACYLIDKLCLRVGDEKDPDEADTVGATTLRPEHLVLHDDGTVEFDFLGKDSVRWHKKISPPVVVQRNLEELRANARPNRNGGRRGAAAGKPQLFPDVSSRDVNAFLAEVLGGLTAKVFRTHHATTVVRESLERADLDREDAEFKKREAATQANLEAAILCNHYKKATAGWPGRMEKMQARRAQLAEGVHKADELLRSVNEAHAALRATAREKEAAAKTPAARLRVAASWKKRLDRAAAKVAAAREKKRKAQLALDRFRSQSALVSKSRTWNLGTSLKSYIDPRVYYDWGQEVGYDVLSAYYSKTLQRKFAWVRNGAGDEEGETLAEGLEAGD